MLGYKLKGLVDLDLTHLMPQPFSLLHSKWLKEASTMRPRHTPSSCRCEGEGEGWGP